MIPLHIRKRSGWLLFPFSLVFLSLACNAPGFGISQLAEMDPEEMREALGDLPAEELLQQLEQDPQFQQLLEEGFTPEEIFEQLEGLEGFEGLENLQGLEDLEGFDALGELEGDFLGEGFPSLTFPGGDEPPPELLESAANGNIPMCAGEYECASLGYIEYEEMSIESDEAAQQKWCVHIQYEVREREDSGEWNPMLYLGVATLDTAGEWMFTSNLYLSQETPQNCADVLENN